MGTVITVIALLFLLFVVFGAYATVKVIGAAKRGVDRTISQARRTVEDTTLRAKTFAQPGPQGELAQLRLTLRRSMRATQDALHASAAEDESLKESLSLFERLSAHGHELDAELKRLETEPDRGTLASRLPGLRERAERITRSADSLRWAARDRAHRFAGDDLDTLSAQIDVEAGALRHWTQEPGPASWPEAPTTDADGSGGQTWPGAPEPGTPEQPTRAAIKPPAQRPTYPWQKKPRPESTT
ncbi:hypothetical protein [Streptomyces sp. NPDC002580]|uniref:hypothetical protein n=1 Tax=Streptomyces sp. NPDC002580 TaxID=3364653 RepID=UPI0036815ED0